MQPDKPTVKKENHAIPDEKEEKNDPQTKMVVLESEKHPFSTFESKPNRSNAEPLRTYLENFKDAFDADFDLKSKIEALTIH